MAIVPKTLTGMDCSHIMFCCGPCVSKVQETAGRLFLKPMDQKRYACSSWLMHDGSVLRLCNLRMCRSCCDRYLEQWDEIQYDDADSIKSMQWDAEMIIKKLGIQRAAVASSH